MLRPLLLGTYAAVALILLASLVVGRAFLAALGAERLWLAPAAGFALLVIVARLAVRMPGHATTSLVALGLMVLAALAYLAIGRRPLAIADAPGFLVPAAVLALLLAATAIPFLANDRVGVLGVGRQSDLQAHIYAADYLTHRVGFGPDAIANGYPLGPHAVVASVSRLTGAGTDASFVGLVLAIPVLVGWTALAALDEVPPVRRVVIASLVGLPFLAATFLTEGTFKETAEGLYLVAFALGMREIALFGAGRRATAAMLVALAAASVYTYSYPGLVWPAAALGVWAVFELIGGWRPTLSGLPRPSGRVLVGVALALVVIAAIALPEVHRIADFRHIVSQVEETKGRLRAPISPAQALGLWPAGNFRIDPKDAALATVMAIAALLALVYGLIWWLARRDLAVPAALAASTLIYLETRRRSGLYIEAKALAVMAPLPMLISLRALLTPPARLKLLFGALICAGAVFSSFLVLRAAPVGPATHDDELARFRPLVAGKHVLFLGLDRLSSHELRGAYVRQGNLLASQYGRDRKPWTPADALDFDSVPFNRLDRFDYVITTNAAFASRPPPNFHRVAANRDYVLWKRTGPTPPRQTLFEAGAIGGRFDCAKPSIEALSRRSGRAGILPGPRVVKPAAWRPGRFFAVPGAARQTLRLPSGRWALSLQYQSPVPLVLRAPGLRVALPPSLDGKVPYFEGGGPFWPAGSVRGGGRVTVTVSAGKLEGIQRLLGVKRRAALGKLAATGTTAEKVVPIRDACGKYVDWFR